MIFDSHIHITEEAEFAKLFEKKKLGVLANAASVSEYKRLSQMEGVQISFGIHPWNADEFCEFHKITGKGGRVFEKLSLLKQYFQQADVMGEIGMDNVWCSCDLDSQRELFIAQLDMAEELGKPVVLHIKGQEKQAANILKRYSQRKLVHWYSCEEHLEKYLSQDCYFTVGPDFAINTAVNAVIEQVPIERLLVETDGVDAVEWAVNARIAVSEIPGVLRKAVKAIAKAKRITVAETEQILEENFHRFVGR